MQITSQEQKRENVLEQLDRKTRIPNIIGGVIFIIFLLILFSSLLHAQDNPVAKLRDGVKPINITVGSPIVNDNTERALKAVDKIPGLTLLIERYNEQYGNDSVHASRFVDREPDEKNTTDKVVQNYYDIIVISDSARQVTRWYSFLVRKDFQEVLYYDLKNGKTAGIDDWKKIWPASQLLGPGEKYRAVKATKQ